jgi:hypothetical protein
MSDSNHGEEEEIRTTLKRICQPAKASANYKEQLLNLINSEQRKKSQNISSFRLRLVCVSAALVLVAAAFLTYGILRVVEQESLVKYTPPDKPPVTISQLPLTTTSSIKTSPYTSLPTSTSGTLQSPTSNILPPSMSNTSSPSASSSQPPTTSAPASSTSSLPYFASVGFLEIKVTDAPPDEKITGIEVYVSNIAVHKPGSDDNDENSWIATMLSDISNFDLLKIQGQEQLMANAELTTGSYSQIRIVIAEVLVSFENGDMESAVLPGGELKLVQSFEIIAGDTTTLLLDFDAAQSVNVTGEGKVIFKPVIKITVAEPA